VVAASSEVRLICGILRHSVNRLKTEPERNTEIIQANASQGIGAAQSMEAGTARKKKEQRNKGSEKQKINKRKQKKKTRDL